MLDARKPAASGVFYPADRDVLARSVRELLDVDRPSTSPAGATPVPRAIIVPHGTFTLSGTVAGQAWARVAPHGSRIRRVVLLGPSHHTQFVGIAAPFADAFATPLGGIAVDRLAIEAARRFSQVFVGDEPHEQEASLEVQLPFVQTVAESAAVVPLLVGEVDDLDAATVIESLWDESTLVVVSTNLSHYYDAGTSDRLDRATARSIEALDPLPIRAEQACGHVAVRALLLAAKTKSLRATPIDLRHSGQTSGDLEEVIGFGSFVFA